VTCDSPVLGKWRGWAGPRGDRDGLLRDSAASRTSRCGGRCRLHRRAHRATPDELAGRARSGVHRVSRQARARADGGRHP
jgi:hypothetical protein